MKLIRVAAVAFAGLGSLLSFHAAEAQQVPCGVLKIKDSYDDLVVKHNELRPKFVDTNSVSEQDTWFHLRSCIATPWKQGVSSKDFFCTNGGQPVTLEAYNKPKTYLYYERVNTGGQMQVVSQFWFKYCACFCMKNGLNGIGNSWSFELPSFVKRNLFLTAHGGNFLDTIQHPSDQFKELASFKLHWAPGSGKCGPTPAPTPGTPRPTPAPTPFPTTAPNTCGLVALQTYDSWTTRFVQHQGAGTQPIVGGVGTTKTAEAWYIRPGHGCGHLSCASRGGRCVSLESYDKPNHWLVEDMRNVHYKAKRVWLLPFEDRDLFHKHSTFCMQDAINGQAGGVSFDVAIYPAGVYLYFDSGNRISAQRVTNCIMSSSCTDNARWRASFRKKHLECENSCGLMRFKTEDGSKVIRHQNYEGKVSHLSPGDHYEHDAWFYVRTCHHDKGNCGNDRCVSLESYNFRGSYLRHSGYYIYMGAFEDHDLYHLDASFCMRPALHGPGVSFESVNYPGYWISSYNEGDRLKIQQVEDRDAQKKPASFKKEYLPCTRRQLEVEGDNEWKLDLPHEALQEQRPLEEPESYNLRGMVVDNSKQAGYDLNDESETTDG